MAEGLTGGRSGVTFSTRNSSGERNHLHWSEGRARAYSEEWPLLRELKLLRWLMERCAV